jgi:hypothetical protein
MDCENFPLSNGKAGLAEDIYSHQQHTSERCEYLLQIDNTFSIKLSFLDKLWCLRELFC